MWSSTCGKITKYSVPSLIYPVVPKDVIMLRIIPTSAHTLEDVEYTVNAFAEDSG